jgi:hypothetical protein
MFDKSASNPTLSPPRVSRVRMLAVLSVALAFLASAASASAVKLGSNDVSSAVVLGFCTPGNSWVQRTTATTSPSYDAPTPGTITSWTTSALSSSTAALKIWRPTSNPHQFIPVAQSATESVPGDSTLHTFSTSIHVKKGDVIGIAAITGDGVQCLYGASGANHGDIAARVAGDPTSGTQTFTDYEHKARLNLSVKFTPTCVVPNLKGKTLTAATHALDHAYCALGTVTKKASSGPAGIVLSQDPQPGTHLPAGSKVDVVLSKH